MIYSIRYKPELIHENKFLLIDENGNERIDEITNWYDFIMFILQLTEDEANIMFTKDKDIRILLQEFGTESIRKIAYRYKISSGSVWSMVTGNTYISYKELYKPYNSFEANRVRNRRDHTPHPIEAGTENLL